MRSACSFLLAVVVIAAADGIGQAETPSAEAEMAARIRARLDAAAQGKATEWAAFVADDCICGLETKAAIQHSIATRPPGVKNWYGDIQDLKLRFLGDTAVARYRIAEHTEVGGQLQSIQVWRTETYFRKAGVWILVAGADTLIPPEPAAVKVDSRLFDDFVGKYQYAAGSVDTVTREGDRLFVQPSGEPRVELFAESETTYFAKGEPWRLIFVKGPQGPATSLTFRQQGQEWTATRIP